MSMHTVLHMIHDTWAMYKQGAAIVLAHHIHRHVHKDLQLHHKRLHELQSKAPQRTSSNELFEGEKWQTNQINWWNKNGKILFLLFFHKKILSVSLILNDKTQHKNLNSNCFISTKTKIVTIFTFRKCNSEIISSMRCWTSR